MADPTKLQLRGLVLSAAELRQLHPEWSGAMIEDYLNIFNNLQFLSDTIDDVDAKKIEEIATAFVDGSIPFANDNLLIEDSRLNWDALARIFTANGVHVSAGRRKAVKYIDASPYNLTIFDEEIFVDTSLIPITINLLPGIDGTSFRIHNTGTSGNTVTMVPDGTELLFGDNSPELLYDTEVVMISYESTIGWD